MLNYGASKPRVKGESGPRGSLDPHLVFVLQGTQHPWLGSSYYSCTMHCQIGHSLNLYK